MTADTLAIIRANGRRLAKLIRPGGEVEGYDLARMVDLIEHPLADLATLHDLLQRMRHRTDCAVIRGAPIGPDRTRVRRLLYADPKTGDAATLRETPRRWLALDLDSLPAPAGLDLFDVAACGHVARHAMPAAFADAAAIVQATASHTIKPGMRLRLWFWLARPMGGAEIKRWLAAAPVDRSVFGAAQPIYTAAPVFLGGADPLPARVALLPGAAEVQPPSPEALAPPPRPPARPIERHAKAAGHYAQRALENAVARILAAKDRHPAIVAEAGNLGRLVAAGLLDDSTMRSALHAAARAVGKDDPTEIDKIIAWTEMHPAGTAPEVQHNAR
jgi:hypothetical protein